MRNNLPKNLYGHLIKKNKEQKIYKNYSFLTFLFSLKCMIQVDRVFS